MSIGNILRMADEAKGLLEELDLAFKEWTRLLEESSGRKLPTEDTN